MIVFGKDIIKIAQVRAKLAVKIKLTDLGAAKIFLEIEILRNRS
jgi:hypothetical protein